MVFLNQAQKKTIIIQYAIERHAKEKINFAVFLLSEKIQDVKVIICL